MILTRNQPAEILAEVRDINAGNRSRVGILEMCSFAHAHTMSTNKMAAALRRIARPCLSRCLESHRALSTRSVLRSQNLWWQLGGASAGLLLSFYCVHKARLKHGQVLAEVRLEPCLSGELRAALLSCQIWRVSNFFYNDEVTTISPTYLIAYGCTDFESIVSGSTTVIWS